MSLEVSAHDLNGATCPRETWATKRRHQSSGLGVVLRVSDLIETERRINAGALTALAIVHRRLLVVGATALDRSGGSPVRAVAVVTGEFDRGTTSRLHASHEVACNCRDVDHGRNNCGPAGDRMGSAGSQEDRSPQGSTIAITGYLSPLRQRCFRRSRRCRLN